MPTPPSAARLGTASLDTRRESIERRILEGAQALIDSGASWHQVGIRQIAERAEISRTAFYDFFASKNDVLEHLVRGLYEELSLGVREVLDPDGSGQLDLHHLRPALAAVSHFAQLHGFAYRALLEAATQDERLADLWAELTDGFTTLITTSIETTRARDASAPRDVDARSIARTLMFMTERCLLIDLDPRTAGEGSSFEALVDIWERAVYGRSPV